MNGEAEVDEDRPWNNSDTSNDRNFILTDKQARKKCLRVEMLILKCVADAKPSEFRFGAPCMEERLDFLECMKFFKTGERPKRVENMQGVLDQSKDDMHKSFQSVKEACNGVGNTLYSFGQIITGNNPSDPPSKEEPDNE